MYSPLLLIMQEHWGHIAIKLIRKHTYKTLLFTYNINACTVNVWCLCERRVPVMQCREGSELLRISPLIVIDGALWFGLLTGSGFWWRPHYFFGFVLFCFVYILICMNLMSFWWHQPSLKVHCPCILPPEINPQLTRMETASFGFCALFWNIQMFPDNQWWFSPIIIYLQEGFYFGHGLGCGKFHISNPNSDILEPYASHNKLHPFSVSVCNKWAKWICERSSSRTSREVLLFDPNTQ